MLDKSVHSMSYPEIILKSLSSTQPSDFEKLQISSEVTWTDIGGYTTCFVDL